MDKYIIRKQRGNTIVPSKPSADSQDDTIEILHGESSVDVDTHSNNQRDINVNSAYHLLTTNTNEGEDDNTLIWEVNGIKIPVQIVRNDAANRGKASDALSYEESTEQTFDLPEESSISGQMGDRVDDVDCQADFSRLESDVYNSGIESDTEKETRDNSPPAHEVESESGGEMINHKGSTKRRKPRQRKSKKRKPSGGYYSSFQEEWLRDPRFSHWLKKIDDETFLCVCCSVRKSVRHDGLKALTEHEASKAHQVHLSKASTQSKIDSYAVKELSKPDVEIAVAEATLCFHAIKHHHSYASVDCESKLLPKIFKDSKTAAKTTCGRTKAAAVVRGALAPYSLSMVKMDLVLSQDSNYNRQPRYFTIMSDGSTRFNKSIYPYVVRYFKEGEGLKEKVISVVCSSDGTAQKLHSDLKQSLAQMGLQVEHVAAFAGDSCSVNFGTQNSVYAKLKMENPKILPLKCPAHLLHNAAKNAMVRYKPDCEAILLKICGHLNQSSKREAALMEVFEYCDVEYQQITKHTNVRWLSLAEGLHKIQKFWKPLKAYFLGLGETKCPQMIWEFLHDQEHELTDENNPTLNEMHLQFWSTLSSVFATSIKCLERTEATIMDVEECVSELVSNLKERVESNYFGSTIDKGLVALTSYEKKCFLDQCRRSVEDAINYIEKRYALGGLYAQCQALNVKKTDKLVFREIADLCQLLRITVDCDLLFSDVVVANKLLRNMQQTDLMSQTLPKIWALLFNQQNERPMCTLFKLVSFVMSIPSSNAFVERIFSVLKAAWTPERNSLLVSSVESEMMVYFNFDMLCSAFPAFLRHPNQKKLIEMVVSARKYLMS
ncbi:uncharacterized protein LOC135946521 [Cloeon dipterum]|uniref:uncharacterized protein LOC135946521 n=1 Tax=Cloeon dipterum TaxID=197152 RepID=UPI00322070EE